MNKTIIDLDNNQILRSQNIEYNNDTLKNTLDKIIESGSNDKGSWIKYNDGTMICYGVWRILKEETIVEGTYPYPFISNPFLIGSVHIEAGVSFTPNVYDTYNTDKQNYQVRINRPPTGAYIQGNFIAIGKWK